MCLDHAHTFLMPFCHYFPTLLNILFTFLKHFSNSRLKLKTDLLRLTRQYILSQYIYLKIHLSQFRT